MLTKAFDTSQGPQIPKVEKKKRGPSKGKAKFAKKIHIDGMLDDEWNYDFDNDINSDEKHVGLVQWCVVLSFHGVGFDVGFNHGADFDTSLDHGINGLDVDFDHGATLDHGLDHGVVLSKSEDDLWNVDNPKLVVPNLEFIIAHLNLGLSPHKVLSSTLANTISTMDNASI